MCMQILQIVLIGQSYKQGLIHDSAKQLQTRLYTPIATLVIHKLGNYSSFTMNQYTKTATIFVQIIFYLIAN